MTAKAVPSAGHPTRARRGSAPLAAGFRNHPEPSDAAARGRTSTPRAARPDRRRSPAAGNGSSLDRERRLFRFIESRSAGSVLACAVVLLAVIGLIDYVTGPEIGVSVFYLIPLALVAWRSGGRISSGLSVLGAVVWYMAETYGGRQYSNPIAPYWNAGMRLGFFVIVTSLIGITRRLVEHERELAGTDPVSGLANSRHFYQEAETAIRRSREQAKPLTVAYIDIDDFKQVNDRLGHAAGDDVIRSVGGAAAASVRASDLASRLGGDEFALLLKDASGEAAAAVLRRLRERLDGLARDRGWPVTFSIGAVTTSTPGGVDELIGRADALMYEVKKSGKNGFRHENLPHHGMPTDRDARLVALAEGKADRRPASGHGDPASGQATIRH